ncbi:GalNAc(5)-diNAcBac-PP-undecaprenol beta-1,3-glucosyltransferase [Rosistilla ulvae]|uniref:GalNAc(5)-diNAcBac-PP-undecaprenol beta-1,3-glucosyltransferase n=1 Tax=Rosistilla ulvae TaxID=1930277 RepID=A0A517LYP8_9BACT|nr:glycosyltransferase family 2 protein [Rosistilla ulvae]QDS87750.1 GalNAc(5)-diNAcBac-PP-undecaprenol beta-1,3-glucosyltransferase [Rosistilla ulvae]
MSKRTFTIVVPTRERADTLEVTLRTVVAQDDDQLQILVSDNCSQDATRSVVESFEDSRIRYLNTGRRLSMSENWEFAISHVESDWVAIIGDDDALLPNCLQKVNHLADVTGAKAIRSATCDYHWPLPNDPLSARLRVPMSSGFEFRRSKDWLHRVLVGSANYSDLPVLYNGSFVSMDVIRNATFGDRFFRSCIPDVYSSMAISNTLDRFVYSREPFAINGASRHSTGSSQFSTDTAKKEASKKFLAEGNYPFHHSVPMDGGDYPKSIHAMIYESSAQVGEVFAEGATVEPATQLKVILAAAGKNRDHIDRWSRQFAEQHELDYEQASVAAVRHRRSLRFHRMKAKMQTSADMRLTGEDRPIADVQQAAEVVGELLRNRSSIATRLAGRFAEMVGLSSGNPSRAA